MLLIFHLVLIIAVAPYYIVYGKEPIDAELKELEELHRYTGTNCGLKRLQQLSDIWKTHADELR